MITIKSILTSGFDSAEHLTRLTPVSLVGNKPDGERVNRVSPGVRVNVGRLGGLVHASRLLVYRVFVLVNQYLVVIVGDAWWQLSFLPVDKIVALVEDDAELMWRWDRRRIVHDPLAWYRTLYVRHHGDVVDSAVFHVAERVLEHRLIRRWKCIDVWDRILARCQLRDSELRRILNCSFMNVERVDS